MQRCNCTGNPASIAWAGPRGTLAVAGCASAVNVAPPSTPLHPTPATARRCILLQESERVYNEPESSDELSGRWLTVLPCPLERPTPFLSLCAPLGPSLITSLSSRYPLLFSHSLNPPSLVHPRRRPLPPSRRPSSGVTLNSGPAAIVTRMCPTTKS